MKQTYEQWVAKVEAEIKSGSAGQLGLTSADFADAPTMEWYEQKKSPKWVANRIVKNDW